MGEFPAERLFLVKDRRSGLDQVLPESTPLQSCAMSVHVTMLCTAALQLLQVCSRVAWQKKVLSMEKSVFISIFDVQTFGSTIQPEGLMSQSNFVLFDSGNT